MKTLLINPPPEEVIELYDAPTYPHIGIGYLAAYLRRAGQDIQVIDSKLEKIDVAGTIKKISDISPDIIGLTAFTQDIIHVSNFARLIKNAHPETCIVIGGVHATTLPRQTLEEFPYFDFLIFGEGEMALNELVEALKNNSGFERIKGLGYRKDGKIFINEPKEWNAALDELPFPAWDMFPRAQVYPLLTSRGCPFGCIFCSRPYGNKVRMRSPENVMSEFRELAKKYNAKNVVFWDETFGLDKVRSLKIADMLEDENKLYGIKWGMHSRVDVMDRETLQSFKKAGCAYVGFGVESGNADILKVSKKGIKLEQVVDTVRTAKELGLATSSYFILGFPGETKKTAWDTINFARKLNTTSVSIAVMIPFPSTKIAEMVKTGQGGYRQISYKWSDYNKQSGAVVELETMDRKALVFFQVTGYLMCYLCNFRFGTFFRTLKLRFKQVLVLARNLFKR